VLCSAVFKCAQAQARLHVLISLFTPLLTNFDNLTMPRSHDELLLIRHYMNKGHSPGQIANEDCPELGLNCKQVWNAMDTLKVRSYDR
jgi:hypothetical protein